MARRRGRGRKTAPQPSRTKMLPRKSIRELSPDITDFPVCSAKKKPVKIPKQSSEVVPAGSLVEQNDGSTILPEIKSVLGNSGKLDAVVLKGKDVDSILGNTIEDCQELVHALGTMDFDNNGNEDDGAELVIGSNVEEGFSNGYPEPDNEITGLINANEILENNTDVSYSKHKLSVEIKQEENVAKPQVHVNDEESRGGDTGHLHQTLQECNHFVNVVETMIFDNSSIDVDEIDDDELVVTVTASEYTSIIDHQESDDFNSGVETDGVRLNLSQVSNHPLMTDQQNDLQPTTTPPSNIFISSFRQLSPDIITNRADQALTFSPAELAARRNPRRNLLRDLTAHDKKTKEARSHVDEMPQFSLVSNSPPPHKRSESPQRVQNNGAKRNLSPAVEEFTGRAKPATRKKGRNANVAKCF